MSVLVNPILVLGATTRLTRLVVVDDIGRWWIKDPIDAAAARWWSRHVEHTERRRAALRRLGAREQADALEVEEPWWWKYRSGLDCPFCVGFWIGVGVLASERLAGRSRPWRFVAAALTLNEVAAHLGARLGDVQED